MARALLLRDSPETAQQRDVAQLQRIDLTLDERDTSIFSLRHGTRANLRSRCDTRRARDDVPTPWDHEEWVHRIEALLDEVEATPDRRLRVDKLLRVAVIYEQRLADIDAACVVLKAALFEDPARSDTRAKLERVATAANRWDEMLAELAECARELEAYSVDDAWRMWMHLGAWRRCGEERLAAYRCALELRPRDRETLEELATLYEAGEQWARAADALEHLAEVVVEPAHRVDLLHRVARLRFGYLDDDERAEACLVQALALDGAHMAAVEDLAELYRARGAWERAAEVLLRAEAHACTPGRTLRLVRAAAAMHREHGARERALELYDRARALAPDDDELAEAVCGLYYELERWAELELAAEALAGGDGAAAERADVHVWLGHARRQLGKRRAALLAFEAALTRAPAHRDALRSALELSKALGDWNTVATSLRALTAGAADDERVDLLDELAGVFWKRLGRPEDALAVCREALAQCPTDRRALQKQLDLLVVLQSWEDALEVLDEFARLELRPGLRGKYLEMAGTICRDQLGAPRHAADYFERALDCYFADGERPDATRRLAQLRPFEALDAIHADAGDLAAREACYLRMIDRLPQDEPMLPRLLDALGELYRDSMCDPAKAVAAFEAAAALEPACHERRALLAQLHLEVGDSSAERAIQHHRVILADEPRNAASLRALRALYTETSQYDKAWCVCAVMTYLDCASLQERRYYATYKAPGLVKSTEPLVGGIWARVRHPREDERVGAIFAAIADDVARLTARSHRHFGLDRKTRRDTEGDQLALTRVLDYVARALGVTLPALYLQPDEPGELLLANTGDRKACAPSLVARGDALRGRRGRELAFMAGRSLTLLRDDHQILLAAPSRDELRRIFAVALDLAGVGAAPGELRERLAPRLSIEARTRLAGAVARAGDEVAGFDPVAWREATELTAQRAGFVLAGDFDTAARAIAREAKTAPGPRLDDLLGYAISESYFAVRTYLGTTIVDVARAARCVQPAA